MFIIFNKGALFVFLLALLFISPIALMWKYDIIKEDTMLLLGSWLLFTASFIGVKMDVNDRIFFIFPTWVITLPCAIYFTYQYFGKVMSIAKIAFLIILSIITVLILFTLIFVLITEKKKCNNLQNLEIKVALKSEGLLNYWKGIRNLFFFPVFYKWTEDIYNFNISVLEHLKENNIELKHCEDFYEELMKMKNESLNGANKKINSKVKDDFFAEIDHQIKTWQNN